MSAVAPAALRKPRLWRRRLGWNAVGLLVFAIMVFPVFWMISTAFKPDSEINSLTPTWFSFHPTLDHFREAIHRPFFWQDVKNSLIIVSVTVTLAILLSFLAAVALAIGAGGALSSIETTALLTVEELMDALGKAQSIRYRRPGT